jgi:WD40 repeat protein
VSLAFLCDFYGRCVAPLPGGAAMSTKQVVEKVIMPVTASARRSFASLVPGAVCRPTAFASHAFGNPFSLLVAALKAHFADAVASEVYVWVDVFAINQHDPGADLHGGRALARTIELAAQTLVVLDRGAFPLTRLWCLYEIGSTPPAKLLFLTHGFSEADVSAAFRSVDVEAAACFDSDDMNRIREHILTHHGSLAAFQQLLRLRLLLKPTSYEADCAALLKRSSGDVWRFDALRAFLSNAADGHSRLACIAGGPGEGKSTLAAALCDAASSPLLVHARHFCKASDVRRQDVGAIIRSLSYQLTLHFPPCAAAVLALSPTDVESLADPAKAWELLLKRPLSTLGPAGTRVVLLFDALDEAGGDDSQSAAISKVLSLILDLGRLNLREGAALSLVVTTRPEEQAVMAPLRGCWRGESFRLLTPAALRSEGTPSSKLLQLLQQRLPAGAMTSSIDAAYQALFQATSAGNADGIHALLAIVLAARQPPSMAQLEALGVRSACTSLPGWGFLFFEREHCVHLLHRSLAEWLTDAARSGRFSVDAAAGHAVWAEHCSVQLRAWLDPASPGSALAPPPPAGSYVYAHALPHLDAAGRNGESRELLLRLPWLQATLREHGLYALLSDVAERMAPGDGTLWTLYRTLRLASPGLQGADAAEALPGQLVGRLGWLPGIIAPVLMRLHDEAHAWTDSLAWLRPVRNTLQQPVGALELCMEGHTAQVTSLAVLGDGCVVSGSRDATLRVWNAYTGECQRTLEGHAEAVSLLVVLGDKRVVSEAGDTLRVWNTGTGECEHTLAGHTDRVTSLIALGDRRVASGSHDNMLRVWNTATGECEHALKIQRTDQTTSLVALGDGRMMSGSENGMLRVWNVATGECERTIKGHTGGSVGSLVALGNGLVVSGSDNRTLRVWNTVTGECENEMDHCFDSLVVLGDGRVVVGSFADGLCVWNVAMDEWERTMEDDEIGLWPLLALADGRVVFGSMDDSTLLRVWNTATCECEHALEGHTGSVGLMVALGSGHAVSASDDRTLRVWNIITGECKRTLTGHTDRVTSLVALDDVLVVSGSWDLTLRVWNAFTGECQRTLEGHTDRVTLLVALDVERVVSGSRDFTLRVWNTATGECERTLTGHTDCVTSLISLGDRRVASGSDDNTLRVWNATTGECEHALEVHLTDWPTSLVALDDERMMSGSQHGMLRVWNVATGECERMLEGHTDKLRPVTSLVALGNGLVVSGSDNRTLRVWNVATGEHAITGGHANIVISLGNGRLVSGSFMERELCVWNAVTRKCERKLKGHTYSGVTALVALGDGRVVSAGSHDYKLCVWNIITGECERTLQAHTCKVTTLVALGDGRLVSGSVDKTLRVWNANTGECERTPLEAHTWNVDLLAVLSDGRVMSTSKDNTLRLWNAATGECCLSVSKSSAEAVSLLAQPRSPHAALTSHELSAAGSCLAGPGFARTYVDAVVDCVCMLPPTPASQQAGGAGVVVGTANGAVHFFHVR